MSDHVITEQYRGRKGRWGGQEPQFVRVPVFYSGRTSLRRLHSDATPIQRFSRSYPTFSLPPGLHGRLGCAVALHWTCS